MREIKTREYDNKIVVEIGYQIFIHITKEEAKEIVKQLSAHME